MSAISTSDLNPPIPCQGVKFGYTTTSLPTLTPNSLGYSYLNQSVSIAVPSNATTVLNTIQDVPAGTYLASCNTTGASTVANVGVAIQTRTPNTATVLQTSPTAYYTAGVSTFENQAVTFVFTSAVPFDAVCVGVADATGSMGVGASALQLVRIA
jgi:hypothetical protein